MIRYGSRFTWRTYRCHNNYESYRDRRLYVQAYLLWSVSKILESYAFPVLYSLPSCADLILVYAIQSDMAHSSASIRCRNLFWRVWSSPGLSQSMTSARLISLWHRCNQDFDFTLVADHANLSRRFTAQPPSTASRNSLLGSRLKNCQGCQIQTQLWSRSNHISCDLE